MFVFVLAACLLVALEKFRGDELQARRTAEQGKLLARLEALNRAPVSRLVADWRMTYPEPSPDRLAELRDLVDQLQADPSAIDDLARSP